MTKEIVAVTIGGPEEETPVQTFNTAIEVKELLHILVSEDPTAAYTDLLFMLGSCYQQSTNSVNLELLCKQFGLHSGFRNRIYDLFRMNRRYIVSRVSPVIVKRKQSKGVDL